MQCDHPDLFPAAIGQHAAQALYGHLIGGVIVGTAGSEPLPVIAPATGQRFAWLSRGGAAEIDAAVQAARTALAGRWGAMSATERGRVMARFATLVLAHTERLAWLEAHDTGKPIAQARADMAAVARYFEFYGGAADKIHGEVIP